MQQVALLGLGIMGAGMAGSLLKQGFPLAVYNRTRSKAEPFAAQGARVTATPREAAQAADVILAMVGDDDASRTVWLGDAGALAGARPGAILVEVSTLSLEWTQELAGIAQARGFRFLETPVTGSKAAAADAQLALFVGGDAAVLDEARPVLEAISRKIVHLGPHGAGATWKLIHNMVLAIQVAGLAEGLTIAEQAGMDVGQIAELILDSPIASRAFQMKLPRMTANRFGDTDFSVQWLHKDTRYAITLAEALGVPTHMAAAALNVYGVARDKGWGEADFAAVIQGVRP